MVVLDHLRCDILIEKRNPQLYHKGELLADFDAIIPRIGASVTFYGTAVVRQFEMMKVFTTTESQALVRSRDKLRSLQILSRAGINLPKTAFTDYSKDPDSLIKKVGEDIEGLKFNTAIAAMMTFLNEATSTETLPKRIIQNFILVLAPFAPHLCEELWNRLGNKSTLAYEPWPKYDESLTPLSTVTIAIQVNGKLRSTIETDPDITKENLLELAKNLPKIQSYLEGKQILKEIAVVGRLVNFVVK